MPQNVQKKGVKICFHASILDSAHNHGNAAPILYRLASGQRQTQDVIILDTLAVLHGWHPARRLLKHPADAFQQTLIRRIYQLTLRSITLGRYAQPQHNPRNGVGGIHPLHSLGHVVGKAHGLALMLEVSGGVVTQRDENHSIRGLLTILLDGSLVGWQ